MDRLRIIFQIFLRQFVKTCTETWYRTLRFRSGKPAHMPAAGVLPFPKKLFPPGHLQRFASRDAVNLYWGYPNIIAYETILPREVEEPGQRRIFPGCGSNKPCPAGPDAECRGCNIDAVIAIMPSTGARGLSFGIWLIKRCGAPRQMPSNPFTQPLINP